jgi:hypothetical protein
MYTWVVEQGKAGKVDIALGDPALATQRQLRYAIPLRGRPHLYMMVNKGAAA